MAASVSRRALLEASRALLAGAAAGALPASAQSPARPVTRAGAIRLAANENPHGPGPAARAAIAAAIGESWKYPMAEEMALRRQIAEREGLSPRHVMIGDGSSEILHIAAVAHGVGGGEILTAAPTFSLAAEHARAIGGSVREVPLDAELRHDLPAMAAAVTGRTRLIYVCNPNNPTGTLVTGAAIGEFVAAVAGRSTVLVDEAYLEFAPDAARHSAVARVVAGDDVIVTRTFSKLHGLAGLRVGYALARPELIERLSRFRAAVAGSLGLAAAAASLADGDFQEFSRRSIREALALTVAALDDLGLRHAASSANFVFFDTGAPVTEFLGAMRERGFALGRPFPPYLHWCRVSMGTVGEMRAFDRALREHYASRPK